MTPDTFYHDQLPLPWNEIWDKIGHNSACTRDICDTFASNREISGSGYQMMSIKFYNDRPWLPRQRDLGQNGL